MDDRTERERISGQAAWDPGPGPDSSQGTAPPTGVGSLLKGRYLTVRELSHGGFGRVFLAHDRQLHNRPVVVKVQLDQAADDPWFERKFGEELRAMALIDHPGVVGVLDSGRTDDGKLFLVIQYIEGSTLRAILKPEGLPLDRAAGLVRQIGRALGAAHEKKVWHRDLKPENIMLQTLSGGDEHVRLIDFGIASIADFTVQQTRVAGSLAYMAPEQVTGQPTAGTDIYAFGVIAYEMLTGRKPFAPEHAAQLAELQRTGVRLKPSDLRPAIPPEAERLILQSLSYNPHERPASAREFGDLLSQALSAPPPVKNKPATRRRTGMWAAIAAAVILTSLGAYFYSRRGADSQPISVSAPARKPKAAHKGDAGAAGDQAEIEFWKSISGSDDPRFFRQYLAQYPHGEFASLARLKLQPPASPAAPKPAPAAPAAPAGPHPGEARLNPRDGLRYVWIPPGSFQMGCSPGDSECAPNERPAHRVRLTKGFWLGQTEVTVEAWSRFAKATVREMPPEPNEGSLHLNPGWAERRFPMSKISWIDSKDYCTWAGGRLPTEAEWEYAARAGSNEARYGPLDEIAWYADNSGKQHVDFSALLSDSQSYLQRIIKNEDRMHIVATRRPNAWGLYDMLGNVNEWVADWAGGSYYKESPEVDPPGPQAGTSRDVRGGAYAREARANRVSTRLVGGMDHTNPRIGCRCALDQLPAGEKP